MADCVCRDTDCMVCFPPRNVHEDCAARIRELEQRLEAAERDARAQKGAAKDLGHAAKSANERADAAEQRNTLLVGLLRKAYSNERWAQEREVKAALAPDSAPPDKPRTPPLQPGAKCSNGAEFWCSLHCPLEHGPVNSGGKNCGWTTRAVCSRHCAVTEPAKESRDGR